MRLSSSCLGMIVILFSMMAVFAFVIFVPGVLDIVLTYGPYLLATLMGGGMIYILFSFLSAENSKAADEVLGIFLDVNNKDIHLFSGHKTAKRVGGADPDRYIQHYFITADGKSFYEELFRHSLTSTMGSGEYKGYSSLKESVVDSVALRDSLQKLSDKLHQPLAVGERLVRNNDQRYVIDDTRELHIEQVEKLYRRQMTVVCNEVKSKQVVWSVKI